MANYDEIAAQMADEQKSANAPGTLEQPAPEPQPVEENKWDSIANRFAQDLGAQIHHNISSNLSTSPEDAAKAQKIAAASAMPVDTVQANLRELEKQKEAERVAEVIKADPSLSNFYGVHENAAIAHDDVDALASISGKIKTLGSSVSAAVGSGFADMTYGFLQNQARGLDNLIGKPFSDVTGLDLPFGNVAEGLGDIRSKYTKPAVEAYQKEMASKGDIEQGLNSAVYSVFQTGPGLLASILSDNPTPALTAMGFTAGAPSVTKAMDQGKSALQANMYGAEDAFAEIMTERIPVAKLIGDVKAGTPFLKTLMHQAAAEVPTEIGATLWQNFNEWANVNPDKPLNQFLSEQPEAVKQTILATVFAVGLQTGAVHGVSRVAKQFDEKNKAKLNAVNLDQINELTGASKLLERDPQRFYDVAQQMVEQSNGPQAVFIPAREMVGYFQSQGVDPYSIADQMPGVGKEELSRAINTDGDVRVPLADYMTYLAKQHGEGLKANIRFGSPNAMTLNQASEFEKEAQGLVDQELQSAQANQERQTMADQMRRQVYETTLNKLLDSGKSRTVAEAEALLHAEIAATTVKSEGEEGGNLINSRYQNLEIKGPANANAPTREANTGLILSPQDRADLEKQLQPEERQFINSAVNVKRTINAIQAPVSVTPEQVQKDLGLNTKPTTLLQSIEKWGGIKSGLTPEELANLQDSKKKGKLTKKSISKYYSAEVMALFDGLPERTISRYVKTDGRSIEDDLPHSAAEAGYLGPQFMSAEYRQTHAREMQQAFAEAVKRELAGAPVYSHDIQQKLDEVGQQANLNLQGRDNVLQELQPYGITPESSLADISRALTRQFLDTEGKGSVASYFQPAPPESSEAFAKWFAGSKMVDGNGAPTVLYHGTQDDVQYFDLTHTNRKDTGWAGEGVYLTDQPKLADAYSLMKKGPVGANVIPVYASIRNPYMAENALALKAKLRAGGKEAAVKFTEELQANGFDGVVLTYPDGTREIIAFEPGQVKSIFNRGTWNRQDPMLLNQSATREQNLAEFMKGSKVVDENGDPLVVYHGTTGDFNTFDKERANTEGDLGAGFYFTNNKEDVGNNYAGEGPDLTQKIQLEAERIASETDRDYSDPEVIAEAKAKFKTNDGNTMPAYLSIKNPVVLGGENPTFLDYNDGFNPDTEEYDNEPSGTLEDFINGLHEASSNFYGADVEQADQAIRENSYDGGMKAEDLIHILKDRDTGLLYAEDDQGRMAVNEIIRQAFEYAGFDGYIDHTVNVKFGSQRRRGQSMAGMDEGTVHYVAFKPEQIKSAIGNNGNFDATDPNILHQNQVGKQEGKKAVAPRGQIQFTTADDGTRHTLISLFKSHDNSTFLHESGHFFLENMFDLAELPNASQRIKDDVKAILDWMGVESRDQVGVDQHEQWARGFESFLMNGKAPNGRLRAAFARFRSWLIGIYRNAKALNVEMTPAIEGVMKRMMASEEEVAQAEHDNYMETMFADLADIRKAGGDVTGAEWDAYQELAAKAHDAAAAEVMGKLVAEQRREARKWWKEEREQVRQQEAEAVLTNPVYQAAHWLGKGTLPDGSQADAPTAKLSFHAVAELLGDEKLVQQMPRYFGMLVTKHGGVHPDVIADLFGLGSGDELVQKLLTTPNPKEVIEDRTDKEMVRRHGDALRDGTIEEQATEAIHNDARGELMARELDMLNKMAKTAQPTTPAAILKQSAERAMRERTVAKVISFDTYLAAERRAANAAQRAFAKGDFQTAMQEKRKQLLNHYMAQFAKNAKAETESFLKFIQRFDSKGTRKALEREYLDQIDGLLERFAFTGSVLAAKEGRDVSFAQFAKRQEENKQEIVYDDKLLNEAYRRHYKELPWEEFSGLMDTVRNLEHLARLTQKAIVDVEQEMFEDQVSAVTETIEMNKPELRQSKNMERTATEKFVNGLQIVDAEHTKMEFLFEDADGYQALGTVWQNFYKPLQDASNRELDMMKGVAAGWRDAFSGYTSTERKEMFAKRHWVPEFNKNVTKGWIMSLALNWGNEGNRKAILDANWGTQSNPVRVDEAAIQRVLDKFMSKRDWEAVQKVWDLIDSLWPEIAKLERELSGVVPTKVEALPVNTPHGQFKGGYYPLKYDPETNKLAERRMEKQIAEAKYGGNYLRAATAKGHTKERVGSAGQRPIMTMNVAVDHLYNAVHDITHRKAILNAVRLIENDKVRAAFAERYGSHYPRIIMKWLNAVAADTNQPANRVEKLLSAVRSNTTVVYMGWKMTTILSQLSGFTNSAYVVGEKEMAKAMGKFFGKGPVSMKEGIDYAFSKSTELRNRRHNFDREVRNELQKLEKGDKQFMLKQSFFYLVGWMDMAVAAPTWIAAYEKGQGMFQGNEAKAIDYADQAVRMAQSSGLAKDLAVIQSSGGDLFKIFTMFYSFFSVTYNQFRRVGRQYDYSNPADWPKALVALSEIWLIPALMGSLLAGQGPDDDEDWLTWGTKEVALFPFSSVVLLRDVANYVARPYFGAQVTPLEGALRSLGDTVGALKDGDIDRKDLHAAFDLAGYTWGLPTKQMWNTGEFMYDWLDGMIEPENPLQAVKGLLFGKHAVR